MKGSDPKIPSYDASFEEIAKQQKINTDILKKEVTEHIDKELDRLNRKLQKIKAAPLTPKPNKYFHWTQEEFDHIFSMRGYCNV